MKKVYIIRHGQTDWNKELRRQGRTDIELNAKGEEQARIMRDKLKDVNFDVCFVSPLKRARRTAEIIIDGKCETIIEELIIEQSMGKLEGTVFGKNEPHNTHWRLGLNHEDENYEELEEMLERAGEFLDKLRAVEAENILVVSHGGFLKGLHYKRIGYDENTDFTDWFLENCEIDSFEL